MNVSLFQKKLLSMQENMMSFALKLTANKDDAWDLLQDTTLKALDNQEKFVDNVNFKGWILTIMHNLFINNCYKFVRTSTVVDQSIELYSLDAEVDSGLLNPDGVCDLREITDAISRLNDELRIPLSLHLSGYKYEEIAEKLQIPLGTVKHRIFCARQKLQQYLRDFRDR